MLNELSIQNNIISNDLKEELLLRIRERRTCYSNVLQFIHNPSAYRNMYMEDSYNIFQLNESAIVRDMLSLLERLNVSAEVDDIEHADNESCADIVEIVEE